MGKKSGQAAEATAFLLRVPMHCRCDGCTDKIRAGVKDLTLHYGIQQLDQSALATKGELKVLLAAGDPDKLRRRLRKTTGKNVDMVPLLPGPGPKQPQANDKDAAAEKELLQALLARGAAAQYGHGQVLPGYAYEAAAAQAYPWSVPLQQVAAYQPAAYHAAAYAYPQGLGGWPGHGGY